jgi:hypothetical protein
MSLKHKDYFGWRIYSNGTACHRRTSYRIDGERLSESDWEEHLKGKSWLDPQTIQEVLKEARQIRTEWLKKNQKNP